MYFQVFCSFGNHYTRNHLDYFFKSVCCWYLETAITICLLNFYSQNLLTLFIFSPGFGTLWDFQYTIMSSENRDSFNFFFQSGVIYFFLLANCLTRLLNSSWNWPLCLHLPLRGKASSLSEYDIDCGFFHKCPLSCWRSFLLFPVLCAFYYGGV